MYDFYFDRIRLPVAPAKLQMKINGKNRAMTLIGEGEINLLKRAGLTDISLTALLPNVRYPFAYYDSGFKNASFFLNELERLKTRTDDNGKFLPFQFIVSRVMPNGKVLYDTNIKVSLEDYKSNDDAKNGFDISVDITLKQFKPYGTKVVEIQPPTPEQPKPQATIEIQRPVENPPTKLSHTVVKGDCLWAIAQKHLGNGNRYPEIYELNKDVIDAKNKGTGNTKYTIYPGQTFVIPSAAWGN
jgi:LysM repeat protein